MEVDALSTLPELLLHHIPEERLGAQNAVMIGSGCEALV